MTGFASAEATLGDGVPATLTMKGVNHRFLDLHVRVPSGCEPLETQLRRRIKSVVERGHIEVALELGQAGSGGGDAQIDESLFASLTERLQLLARQHGLRTEFDPVTLLRVAGVLVQPSKHGRVSSDLLQAHLPPMMEEVLASFQQVRQAEGEELAKELRAGMSRLTALLRSVRELRAGMRQAQFDRLRERLRQLLLEIPVDENRLLMEAAMFAEKSDVEEEIVRLQTHTDRFVGILDEGGAIGKRLDFLLQEFSREANTILSKSGSAAGAAGTQLVSLGLEMKTEIERAREQVQNLE